jgi:hypothetical protein
MRAPPARVSTHDRIGRLSARHLVVGLSQHPQSVDVVGPPGGFQRRDVVLALPVFGACPPPVCVGLSEIPQVRLVMESRVELRG